VPSSHASSTSSSEQPSSQPILFRIFGKYLRGAGQSGGSESEHRGKNQPGGGGGLGLARDPSDRAKRAQKRS
jgi:hypothetical protein